MGKHTSSWLRESAVYQINPRTFCEDGTIRAVTEELPALRELGFRIVYLFAGNFSEDEVTVTVGAGETLLAHNATRCGDWVTLSAYGYVI